MKVLIMGLPGAGKSFLAEPLAELLDGVWINADQVRGEYDDWDFSQEGRVRQSMRMKYLSDGVVRAGKLAITDFVCPTPQTREEFAPDYIIWMDTIQESRFEDTNKVFQKPEHYDYRVDGWYVDTPEKVATAIREFMNNDKT